MPLHKRIALIAHDNRKPDLVEWALYNRETLARHELYGTGTTGALVAAEPTHRRLQHPDRLQPLHRRLSSVEPSDERGIPTRRGRDRER